MFGGLALPPCLAIAVPELLMPAIGYADIHCKWMTSWGWDQTGAPAGKIDMRCESESACFFCLAALP
jgi:hypothetical protein